MDRLRVGRSFRALRIRSGRRQEDIGRSVGCSRQLIAKIEAGDIGTVALGSIVRIGEELGATVDLNVRWRGEGLDRLLDAAHATLVDQVVSLLQGEGWETAVEASFNIRGERGSVDVMALRREIGCVLIVEVKSVVPDAGSTLYTLDRKVRLAPEIARSIGWPCASISKLLVVGDSSTTRRRVAALGATFRSTFPIRGWAVRRWLREPVATMAGLLFLPYAIRGGAIHRVTGRQRVRRPKSTCDGPG